MKLKIILLFSFLIIPCFVFADGGMMIWPPDVYLDQSAQNAIVAWNGEEEIIILSNDIKGSASSTALRMVPLPSNPTEIKQGSFESFEKIVEIMNKKIEEVRDSWQTTGEGHKNVPAPGIEITFHKIIGAHDVTVVKINNLDYFLNWVKGFAKDKGFSLTYESECGKYHYSTCPEGCVRKCIPSCLTCEDCGGPGSCSGGKITKHKISSEFRAGVDSYLKRDIRYFVFDVISSKQGEESIKPLIYRFNSDSLYYPISISGASEISESRAKIRVFLIADSFSEADGSYWKFGGHFGYPVSLTKQELEEINEDIANLFSQDVEVRTFDYYGLLKNAKKDLVLFPASLWQRNLGLGSRGEDVKTLQKVLINEGVWDSEVEATGYFGIITQKALSQFQEKYKYQILKPMGLEKGTGYFGKETKEFFEKASLLSVVAKKQILVWSRNLSLGMRGEDVEELQRVLIAEKVWQRPDVEATGYFGLITNQAVIKFQEKHSSEILESVGLKKGTGFVGASTRSYLNK
ncbi:DUF2330 domain-containing protein [Candidatus Parcubacteria bacterium]|nr:DUF2330 domain-containing protein [Candidatus Parcubacteria bacterium]